MSFRLLSTCAVLVAAGGARAQESVPAPAAGRPLSGGARLLVVAQPAEEFAGEVRVRAGSAFEPADKAGMAALLCRALRSGGSMRGGGRELDLWLEARGAWLETRAAPDHVAITFGGPSASALELLQRVRDLLLVPAYPAETVDAERLAQLAALQRSADDPAAHAEQALLELAYGAGSPQARAPTRESLQGIRREDLLAFPRAHFGLDRIWIGLAGLAASAELEQELDRIFREIPKSAELSPPERTPVAASEAPRAWMVDVPGSPRAELRLIAPGPQRGDEDEAALEMWAELASERTPPPLEVLCLPRWSAPGEWRARASAAPEDAGRALRALLARFSREAAPDWGEEAFEGARARVLAARAPPEALPLVLARELELAIHAAPPDSWERRAERLRALTLAEVLDAARRRLPERLITVAAGPAEPLERALREVVPVKLYRGRLAPMGSPEGRALRARMLTALGGGDVWARLTALHLEGEVLVEGFEEPIAIQLWRDFEGERLRLQQATKSGKGSTQVVLRGAAWTESQSGFAELPETQRQRVLYRERRQLHRVLHELASGAELEVSAGDGGRLEVRGGGEEICWIEVGADGRPLRLGYSTPNGDEAPIFELGDWSQTGGYVWPATVRQPSGRGTEGSVFTWTRFVPNPELPEKLFNRPR
ncbi:MAG TPA: insulinase family protein [Planctomycetota bacterium]|nr:insulinase family protein [Planctomycetota bacterium]